MAFPIKTTLQQKIFFGGLLALIFAALVWAVYTYFPGGHDWNDYYRLSALSVLSLKSPYSVTFHSPPWIVLPLIPFALLPPQLGFSVLFWVGLITTGYVCYRLGAKPLAIAAVLLSYPVLFISAYGNIEWLVFLGLILPPRWGLFLVLAKPQSSIAVVIYWLVEAYRKGGIKQVIADFAPVSICLLLSFIVFGPWYNSGISIIGVDTSSSLWPYSIPLGIVFLISAIRTRRFELAIIASPFLAPYLAVNGWSVVLIGLSTMQWETVGASLAIWIVRWMTGKFLN